MRKFATRVLAGAVALFGVAVVANSASAGTVILDISLAGKGITVVSSPADDLATATSISTASWSLVEAFTELPPLTGAITSFKLTNPVELSSLATNTLTLLIAGKTYTDKLTQIADLFTAVEFTGDLTGPGLAPGKITTELDVSFNQAFGKGHGISGNATFAVLAVPEASTWTMMVLGFAGLGYAAFRRNAKARVIAEAI
jgi:hypothetical protein